MGTVPPRPLSPMGRLRESLQDTPSLQKAADDLCETYGVDSVEEALDLAYKQATRATWGVTLQEAANALMSMFGGNRDKLDMPYFKDATNRPVFISHIDQDEPRPGQYEDAVVDYGEC